MLISKLPHKQVLTQEQYELQDLFLKYPAFFYSYISYYYPLPLSLVDYLEEDMDFGALSCNENLNFTVPLIVHYYEQINVYDLSKNEQARAQLASLDNESLDSFKYCIEEGMMEYYEASSRNPLEIGSRHGEGQLRASRHYGRMPLKAILAEPSKVSWPDYSASYEVDWSYELLEQLAPYLWLGENPENEPFGGDGLELYLNESVPWDVRAIRLFAHRFLNRSENCKCFVSNPSVHQHIGHLVCEEMVLEVCYQLSLDRSVDQEVAMPSSAVLELNSLRINAGVNIIKYLSTYALEMSGLCDGQWHQDTCSALACYQQWLHILSQFEGCEQDFFKAHYMPVCSDSLMCFIDLSTEGYTIFSVSYTEGQWQRHLLVKDSRALMLAVDDKTIDLYALQKNRNKNYWDSVLSSYHHVRKNQDLEALVKINPELRYLVQQFDLKTE